MTKRRFGWAPPVLSTMSALLLLSGCFGGGGTEPESEPGAEEPQEEPEEEPQEEDPAEEPAGPEALPMNDQQIGESVFYSGVEYEFVDMTVVDLDEEAGNDGGSPRMHGAELTFEINAYNPSNDTVMPNPRSVLRWNEDGGENVAEANGRGEFNQVPADSSTSGELAFTLDPNLLEGYDADSARIVVAGNNEVAAVLPLGPGEELINRFPVPQEQIDGEEIVAGPLTITMDEVQVRWNYGTPQQGQAKEGDALLVLDMTIENTSDSNACSRRGQGKTMFLKDADGNGYVDLGLSERCFDAGTSQEVVTGFEIPADYEGSYNLEFDVDQVGDQEERGDIDIEVISGEGVAPSASR